MWYLLAQVLLLSTGTRSSILLALHEVVMLREVVGAGVAMVTPNPDGLHKPSVTLCRG